MSEPSKVDEKSNAAWSYAIPSLTEAVKARTQPLLQAQTELAKEAQEAMSKWMKRRQDAFDASLQSLQKFSSCKEPAAIADVYREWLTGGIDRIVMDMNEARDEALRFLAIGQKSTAAMFPPGSASPANGGLERAAAE